jgi:hypothetical protein
MGNDCVKCAHTLTCGLCPFLVLMPFATEPTIFTALSISKAIAHAGQTCAGAAAWPPAPPISASNRASSACKSAILTTCNPSHSDYREGARGARAVKLLMMSLPQVRRRCWIQPRCSSAPQGPAAHRWTAANGSVCEGGCTLGDTQSPGKKAHQELQSFTSCWPLLRSTVRISAERIAYCIIQSGVCFLRCNQVVMVKLS